MYIVVSLIECAHVTVIICSVLGIRETPVAQVGMQQSGLGLGQGSLLPGQQPGGSMVDMAMAAQHREVAALRDQMAALRHEMHEMTAMRQGSSAASTLHPLQQVLTALRSFHWELC